METAYISIIIKSLEDKEAVLDKILALNKQQKILWEDQNVLPTEIEENLNYKANLVKELERLDDGFESTFAHVWDILKENKEQYKQEIARMQELVKSITEKTNEIQTQEARNRRSAQEKFANVRNQVRGVRNSQRVVNQYYQNMKQQRGAATIQIIDDKQ